MNNIKRCGQCKILKDNLQFSNSQFHKSGGICRLCNTENMKQYTENNSDKIKRRK